MTEPIRAKDDGHDDRRAATAVVAEEIRRLREASSEPDRKLQGVWVRNPIPDAAAAAARCDVRAPGQFNPEGTAFTTGEGENPRGQAPDEGQRESWRTETGPGWLMATR